ncbi:MAG: hypothetical protein ABIK44_06440 [candidate division WOR-3 bacterium]
MNRLIVALVITGIFGCGLFGQYRLPEWVIDEGGRPMISQAGNYVQHGSFHQTTIGLVTAPGVNYVAWVGYWHPRPRPTFHDVATRQIIEPGAVADTLRPVTPRALLTNYGTTTENFMVYFTMTGPGGMPVYTDSLPMILAAHRDTAVTFRPFQFHVTGPYVARCSCYLDRDENRANDVVVKPFKVSYRPPWPEGWCEVEPMPVGSSGRGVKDGGWLAFMAGRTLFFAAKGNKTGEFYSYDPVANEWSQLPSIPKNPSGKLPSKGAMGVTDGFGCVYATTGRCGVMSRPDPTTRRSRAAPTWYLWSRTTPVMSICSRATGTSFTATTPSPTSGPPCPMRRAQRTRDGIRGPGLSMTEGSESMPTRPAITSFGYSMLEPTPG